MASQDCIEYRVLDENDSEAVCRILQYDFTSNEPASVKVNLRGDCAHLLSYRSRKVTRALKQHNSIGAYKKCSGELVACAVAWVPMKIAEKRQDTYDSGVAPLNFRQMFALQTKCFEGVAGVMGDDKYMELTYLACRQGYTGHGIATKLFGKVIDLAREKSCKKLLVVAFNHYVQRVAGKYGFQYHKEVFYSDYVDPVTNNTIFHDMPPPHVKAAALIKIL